MPLPRDYTFFRLCFYLNSVSRSCTSSLVWLDFSIFTATFLYPIGHSLSSALALITFPNSPSPMTSPKTRFFLGNSHFLSTYKIRCYSGQVSVRQTATKSIGISSRPQAEEGRKKIERHILMLIT